MKLTHRLQAVADFVKPGAVVADIGTDHGYLAVYLTKNNICPYVYASDVNQGPLNSAKEQVNLHGLSQRIELVLSHGADQLLNYPIDQVVLAGMGGGLMAEIMDKHSAFFQGLDSVVLQPMTGHVDLRKFLVQKGYTFIDERLALEKHRLYQIWLVSYGQVPESPWDEVEWHLGRRMLEKGHPLLPELIDREEKKWQTILTQCEHKSTVEVRQRWQEATTLLKALKEVKQLDHLQRYFTDHRQ